MDIHGDLSFWCLPEASTTVTRAMQWLSTLCILLPIPQGALEHLQDRLPLRPLGVPCVRIAQAFHPETFCEVQQMILPSR
jgi:hypothetical protein